MSKDIIIDNGLSHKDEQFNKQPRKPRKYCDIFVQPDEGWVMQGAVPFDDSFETDDAQVITREALNRLVQECGERQVELFARHALLGEDRETLAVQAGFRNADSISVVKSRLMPKFKAIMDLVLQEDYLGKMKISPDRLQFLKPHLKWL